MIAMLRFFQRHRTAAIVLIASVALAGCGKCNCSVPKPGSTPVGVISCSASGTGAVGVICASGKTYAFVGKGESATNTDNVEQVDISTGSGAASAARHTLSAVRPHPAAHYVRPLQSSIVKSYTLDFAPTACSSDENHLRVFCGGFSSSKIADIDASAQSSTEFDTGATGSLGFSGGSCTICAIAYDPMDNAFIIMEPNTGGTGPNPGEFVRWSETTHASTMTILDGDPNENPGYDYVKNWIFTPQYDTTPTALQIADFTSGTLYTSSTTFPQIGTPDSGNVDVVTHVAVTPNEFNPPDIFTTADLGTVTLNSPSAGMFTVTGNSQTLTINNAACGDADNDDNATDSVLHMTFVTGEFCPGGRERMGFILLPTTDSSTTISDWAFVTIPPTPDSLPWDSAHDPHPVAAFNDPVNCPDCAIIVNQEITWLGVVNLAKLKAAPRSGTDPHSIDPTYDLQANGVLKYYAI
jgi:hypothetical protein